MIPIELQIVGFPPSLLDFLLQGQLTEPMELPFTSPLAASRAKRGLYLLMKQYCPKAFKISQQDSCTLILKPSINQRPGSPEKTGG